MSDSQPGRPSDYNPNIHPKDLLDRMSKGETDAHIMRAWRISRGTLHNWIKKYPELKEAREQGQAAWEATWLDKGIEFMEGGKDKAYRYWKEILAAKGGDEYRNNQGNTSKTTNIQVNQISVSTNQSEEELLKILHDKLAKLQSSNPLLVAQLDQPKIIDIADYESKPSSDE